MHSDWFNGIDILQGRWQDGEKVGYCYPSGLEKTLCKWEVYVPLVTKGLRSTFLLFIEELFRQETTYIAWYNIQSDKVKMNAKVYFYANLLAAPLLYFGFL
jgi:hypothetical protein